MSHWAASGYDVAGEAMTGEVTYGPFRPKRKTFASLPPELKRRVVERCRDQWIDVNTSWTSGLWHRDKEQRMELSAERLESYICGETPT